MEVPDEYRKFIHTAKEKTEPWWKRLCEQFEVCEIDSADLSVAFIIGISDYQYLPKLETTQNDAPEFADFLLNSGEFDQVILLMEHEATRRAIVYFMDTYIPELMQSSRKRNRFLFYFSGHGERHRYIDRGYLRLANNQPGDYTESIGMDTVATWARVNTANAVHSLFLIDTCMSGIVGQEKLAAGDNEASIDANPSELIKREAGILITAGTENQPANAHRKWNGSLFNKAVLDGLHGKADKLPEDGVITSRELYLYVRSFVSRQSEYEQTPKHWVLREFESGDFFFLAPGGRPKPSQTLHLPTGGETQGSGRASYEVEEMDRQYMAKTVVRVRSGPGTNYSVLDTLRQGKRVWVTGKVLGKPWFRVDWSQKPAYIFSSHLQPTDMQITAAEDTVYPDNYIITDRSDLIKLAKYNKINGNLTIDKTRLGNLDELINLKEIYGDLNIRWNHSLASLQGLSNLETVNGAVRFFDNNALRNFTGLNNIEYIGGELHFRWEDMDNFDGFDKLREIGGNFVLHDNNKFSDLNGFGELATIRGDLYIQFNSRMNQISGFAFLKNIGGKLVIQENESLPTSQAYKFRDILGQRGWRGTTIIQKNR